MNDFEKARLEINARAIRYDPHLDAAADLMAQGDTAAWTSLPVLLQDAAGVYLDLRNHYRRAVAAGAVADDRGPTAP